MSEFAERVTHYGTKCRQHLSRVRLAHVLALRAVGCEQCHSDQRVENLICESFGSEMPAAFETKLCEVLHKVHFMSLKVNFELFLNRILSTIWAFHFTDLAPTISVDKPLSLRELATSVTESNATAREFIIDKIVPRYGLERFETVLEKATHIQLRDLLKAEDLSYWPQIYAAFEIRNLVEHCDGHVSRVFRKQLAESWNKSTLWAHSSWGERQKLNELTKVVIDEEDVTRTYTAMLKATTLLTEAVLRWGSVKVRGRV